MHIKIFNSSTGKTKLESNREKDRFQILRITTIWEGQNYLTLQKPVLDL